jgi:cytochrome P450
LSAESTCDLAGPPPPVQTPRAIPRRSRIVSQSSIWQQILDYSNRADPYPLYARLRKTPVVREQDGTYVVSTYREIVDLLHDPRLSSDMRNFPEYDADAQASEEGAPELPPSFIRIDPPEHDRIRRLLTWNFGPPHRPGRVDSMLADMFEIVTSEIDDLAAKDRSGTTQVDIVDARRPPPTSVSTSPSSLMPATANRATTCSPGSSAAMAPRRRCDGKRC